MEVMNKILDIVFAKEMRKSQKPSYFRYGRGVTGDQLPSYKNLVSDELATVGVVLVIFWIRRFRWSV